MQTLVEQFLNEEGLKYAVLEEGTIIGFGMSGKEGKFLCYVIMDEAEGFMLVHSRCGFSALQEKRQEMAELMTRINLAIKVGNFEMDFEDGEMRFKTSIRIAPEEASLAIVKHLILTNILTMDKAHPILMEMIFGTATPKALCEKFKASND